MRSLTRLMPALCLALLGGVAQAQAQPKAVSVCSEPGDGPPWFYWRGEGASRELAGFTADFWPAVFKRLGREVRMVGDMPWKRCLRAVASGEVDFASGAYRDPERERLFAYSEPYKTLTPQVFFSARKPLAIRGSAELRKYRGCGMNGSSYAHYGLSDKNLDLGSRSYATLISKLLVGNCDYFVEELEVIDQLDGGRHRYLERGDLLHAAVPDAAGPAMHLVTARTGVHAEMLPAINQALRELQKSGELARIWKKNAGDLAF